MQEERKPIPPESPFWNTGNGFIISECPDHNDGRANSPKDHWKTELNNGGMWSAEREDVVYSWMHLPICANPVMQRWHVRTDVTCGTHEPTRSKCHVLTTEGQAVNIYWVSRRPELGAIHTVQGYKIVEGPQGTINKYLAFGFIWPDGTNWPGYDYIGLGKFFDRGYFLDKRDAYNFSNEMLYKEIAVLNQQVTFNNIALYNLK